MRRVIVWRHGETAHNAGGVYQGHLDTVLSERGQEQAALAARALAAREPVRLVSSDPVSYTHLTLPTICSV